VVLVFVCVGEDGLFECLDFGGEVGVLEVGFELAEVVDCALAVRGCYYVFRVLAGRGRICVLEDGLDWEEVVCNTYPMSTATLPHAASTAAILSTSVPSMSKRTASTMKEVV